MVEKLNATNIEDYLNRKFLNLSSLDPFEREKTVNELGKLSSNLIDKNQKLTIINKIGMVMKKDTDSKLKNLCLDSICTVF